MTRAQKTRNGFLHCTVTLGVIGVGLILSVGCCAFAASHKPMSPRPTAIATDTLVADIASPYVSVTTGFSGTDVLVFGTMTRPADLAITMTGPEGQIIMRKKIRLMGFWIDRDAVTFDHWPSYFAIATSVPFEKDSSPLPSVSPADALKTPPPQPTTFTLPASVGEPAHEQTHETTLDPVPRQVLATPQPDSSPHVIASPPLEPSQAVPVRQSVGPDASSEALGFTPSDKAQKADKDTLVFARLDVAQRPPSIHASDVTDTEPYFQSLLALQHEHGLYLRMPAAVKTVANTLFRVSFALPSGTPLGTYSVHIYSFSEDKLTGETMLPVVVREEGLSATIFELAEHHALLYALLTLALSIGIGAGSAALFSRLRG